VQDLGGFFWLQKPNRSLLQDGRCRRIAAVFEVDDGGDGDDDDDDDHDVKAGRALTWDRERLRNGKDHCWLLVGQTSPAGKAG
jgi:hypothetical protein